METPLGRGLLVGLVVLIVLAILLLVPTLLRLLEPETPPQVIIPTPIPTATPVPPTPTSTPTPSPTPQPTAVPVPTPLPPQVGYTVHTVAAGETLAGIARRYGSLGPAIASLNRFAEDAPLGEGQPLVIPLFGNQNVTATLPVRGLEVSRGLPGPRVAVTLDAGADAAPAAAILDTLKAHDVHATFFITGKWAEANPDLLRRIAAEGHEIGNHTYSHPQLPQLEDSAIIEEVEHTEQIIRDLAGQTTRPYLRPPYGNRTQHVLDVLAREGYISIYWTVDSLDSVGEPKSAQFLFDRVTHPTDGQGNPIPLEGAIFLMHVGNETTAEALPDILDWFQENGYQVVPISEILRPQPVP
jgi:peptidoglycan/xylan/chitin deacetylase (PgdA/CDA1 family)